MLWRQRGRDGRDRDTAAGSTAIPSTPGWVSGRVAAAAGPRTPWPKQRTDRHLARTSLRVAASPTTRTTAVTIPASRRWRSRLDPVNDAPVFSAGPNQAVLEGAGAQTVDHWGTGVSGTNQRVQPDGQLHLTGNTRGGARNHGAGWSDPTIRNNAIISGGTSEFAGIWLFAGNGSSTTEVRGQSLTRSRSRASPVRVRTRPTSPTSWPAPISTRRRPIRRQRQ